MDIEYISQKISNRRISLSALNIIVFEINDKLENIKISRHDYVVECDKKGIDYLTSEEYDIYCEKLSYYNQIIKYLEDLIYTRD